MRTKFGHGRDLRIIFEATMQTEPKVGGVQSVFRALRLLKLVALHHPSGIKVAGLAQAAGLERTTTYRLLAGLVEAGFVVRDTRKVYSLGLESMQLGLTAMNRAPILERCRPMMQRLARLTEDTVFLVVRNGDFGHCVHYEEGSFPVRASVLQVGDLRLLGIGSAGVALLSTLPDKEIAAMYARHREEYAAKGFASYLALQALAGNAKENGYSKSESLVIEGVSGTGVAFEITPGAFAAVSIAAIANRARDERRKWIASQMLEQLAAEGFQPAHAA
jgi:DNA-binding IclR family transcriptional regulator